jgi:hypothetical protein
VKTRLDQGGATGRVSAGHEFEVVVDADALRLTRPRSDRHPDHIVACDALSDLDLPWRFMLA